MDVAKWGWQVQILISLPENNLVPRPCQGPRRDGQTTSCALPQSRPGVLIKLGKEKRHKLPRGHLAKLMGQEGEGSMGLETH